MNFGMIDTAINSSSLDMPLNVMLGCQDILINGNNSIFVYDKKLFAPLCDNPISAKFLFNSYSSFLSKADELNTYSDVINSLASMSAIEYGLNKVDALNALISVNDLAPLLFNLKETLTSDQLVNDTLGILSYISSNHPNIKTFKSQLTCNKDTGGTLSIEYPSDNNGLVIRFQCTREYSEHGISSNQLSLYVDGITALSLPYTSVGSNSYLDVSKYSVLEFHDNTSTYGYIGREYSYNGTIYATTYYLPIS